MVTQADSPDGRPRKDTQRPSPSLVHTDTPGQERLSTPNGNDVSPQSEDREGHPPLRLVSARRDVAPSWFVSAAEFYHLASSPVKKPRPSRLHNL